LLLHKRNENLIKALTNCLIFEQVHMKLEIIGWQQIR